MGGQRSCHRHRLQVSKWRKRAFSLGIDQIYSLVFNSQTQECGYKYSLWWRKTQQMLSLVLPASTRFYPKCIFPNVYMAYASYELYKFIYFCTENNWCQLPKGSKYGNPSKVRHALMLIIVSNSTLETLSQSRLHCVNALGNSSSSCAEFCLFQKQIQFICVRQKCEYIIIFKNIIQIIF